MRNINEAFLSIVVDPAIKVSIKFVQFFYFKYLYKFFLCLYDQRLCKGCDYDIVDIETKEDIFVFIYKVTDIRDKCFEAVFFEYGNDDVILLFWGAM